MANSWTIQAEALDGFRRLYGVAANPEEMPREWAAVVAEVRDCLNEMIDDLDAHLPEYEREED